LTFVPECTILRLRGSINLPKNEAGPTTIQNFALGIAVMELGAAKLGAFPNPATPEGGDWDGWMFYRSQQTAALDSNASIVDVKAMRKLQSGNSFIIVAGSFFSRTDGAAPSSGAFDVQINLRALILLP